ncbi:MAG: hypothetical protein E7361_01470 [Clostridiales bacterium]|nr:hypothetical protein [Clostridiales bacterium]
MNYTYLDIDYNFNNKDEVLDYLSDTLSRYGLILNNYSAISFSTDDVKKYIRASQNDLIFIKLSSNFEKNKEIKEVISDCFQTFLVKNSAASFAIESYLRLHSGEIGDNANFENESLIPDGSEPLTSDLGYVQGFYLSRSGVNLVFLPPDVDQVSDIFNSKLIAILSRLYDLPQEFIYLKCFGLTEDALTKILMPFMNNSVGVSIQCRTDNLDTLISVGYKNSVDRSDLQEFVAKVCESLGRYLYATEDISLYQMAIDLVKLTSKRISVLESVTKGKLIRDMVMMDDEIISYITNHNIITKVKDLGMYPTIDLNDIARNGMYSVDSAYEVATAMIDSGECDVVVASLGAYNIDTHVANCFLAIGNTEGVHIYKHTYKGKLSEIIDLVTKNICYYLIRMLKQNNLLFDQTLTN